MQKQLLVIPLSVVLLAWAHGATPQAPCDIVICAEAHSVTRAMKSSYAGPLFQISKAGGSTLDIGQVSGHADMSTWSAFCGGVQSNCWFTKIYAQIHITTNDLSNYNGISNSGTPFQIEAATGLPIAISPPTTPFNILAGAIHTDANSTGVTSGGAALSVYYVGRFDALGSQCCGVYGMYHLSTAPLTPGTDFAIMPEYGTGGFAHCGTASTYCLQIDEEINTDGGDVGSSPIDLIGVVTLNPAGSQTVAGYVNNHAIFSHSPPAVTLNPGLAMHLFVGGDLTQSGNHAIFREGAITNSTLTPAQVSALTANAVAFYASVSFP